MRKVLLAVVSFLSVFPVQSQLLFDEAVKCIKRYEGLHSERGLPYVGYGHRLLGGEYFDVQMTEQGADSLLRTDLKQKCRVFGEFGQDSLLLGVLAYNVGESRVLRSQLVRKLRSGYRAIYLDYISFRLINGKVSQTLEKRRKEEFNLLYNVMNKSYDNEWKPNYRYPFTGADGVKIKCPLR